MQQDLRDGQHRNEPDRPEYFTTAFFHEPAQLAAEVAEAGFESTEIIAVEGPVWIAADFSQRWADPGKREVLLDLARAVESEPSLHGMTPHLMAIARA